MPKPEIALQTFDNILKILIIFFNCIDFNSEQILSTKGIKWDRIRDPRLVDLIRFSMLFQEVLCKHVAATSFLHALYINGTARHSRWDTIPLGESQNKPRDYLVMQENIPVFW